MSEWIKRHADDVNEQATEQQNAALEQARQTEVVAREWQGAWRALVAAIHADAKSFNSELPDHPDKHLKVEELTEDLLQITRESTMLTCQASGTGIETALIRLSGTDRTPQKTAHLQWSADQSGRVGVQGRDRVAIGALLSEQILTSLFPSP